MSELAVPSFRGCDERMFVHVIGKALREMCNRLGRTAEADVAHTSYVALSAAHRV